MASKKSAKKQRPAKAVRKPAAKGTSDAAVGKHLDLSRQRVPQLVAEGVFKKTKGGKLDLDECRIAYIRFLRATERRVNQSAETNKFRDARAREIDLRIAREEMKLIDIDDVDALVGEIVGGFRSDLSGVPAACTRDLAMRRLIEMQLNGAIDRCRKRFEEAQRNHWDGSESAVDNEEAGA